MPADVAGVASPGLPEGTSPGFDLEEHGSAALGLIAVFTLIEAEADSRAHDGVPVCERLARRGELAEASFERTPLPGPREVEGVAAPGVGLEKRRLARSPEQATPAHRGRLGVAAPGLQPAVELGEQADAVHGREDPV